MEVLGKISKKINNILDFFVGILIILIILFSSYSLYTSYNLYKGSYISDELKSLKPSIDPDTGILTFDEIRKINSDVVGWISVDNTNIDHPVVQGKNNLEYVNKDIYGEFAFEGTIFLDTRNNPKFEDIYSLLYGHHMEHGAMFGDLHLFLEKDFFEKNKTGKLITEDKEYHVDFFSLVETDGYDSWVFNPESVKDRSNLVDFLSYIEFKSTNHKYIEIGENDRIIGLSTCESALTNGRKILYGVIRID